MKTCTFLALCIVTTAILLAACGGNATPSKNDPAAIITAINEKMNAGDVDSVMALIAEDAVFYNAPGMAGGPKLDTPEEIRAWIQRQVDTKTMAEISKIQVNGDTVTWHAKVTRNGGLLLEADEEAKVKDGKLVERTFK